MSLVTAGTFNMPTSYQYSECVKERRIVIWPGRRELDDASTSQLRRGGEIASSSSLVLRYSYSYTVYFVFDSASELERWALLPFEGFPALTCFLFF